MLLTGKQELHTVAFWKKIVQSQLSKPSSYMVPNMLNQHYVQLQSKEFIKLLIEDK